MHELKNKYLFKFPWNSLTPWTTLINGGSKEICQKCAAKRKKVAQHRPPLLPRLTAYMHGKFGLYILYWMEVNFYLALHLYTLC